MASHFGSFCAGVRDALSFHKTLVFFVHDEKLGRNALKCLALNGLIFMGSILLFDMVILPATQRFRALLGMHATGDAAEVWDAYAPTVGAALDALLSLLFQATWTVPIYLLSFVLNQIWYQEIADAAYARHVGRPHQQGGAAMVRDFVYQTLVYVALLAQMNLARTLGALLEPRLHGGRPWLSFGAFLCYMSWSFSLYAFDYKWALRGWNAAARFDRLERHWAFFLGFGAPCTLATVFLPSYFISYGIYALLFPLFVLLAIRSGEDEEGGVGVGVGEAREAAKAAKVKQGGVAAAAAGRGGGEGAAAASAASVRQQTAASQDGAPPRFLGQLRVLRQAKWVTGHLIRLAGKLWKADMSAPPKRTR